MRQESASCCAQPGCHNHHACMCVCVYVLVHTTGRCGGWYDNNATLIASLGHTVAWSCGPTLGRLWKLRLQLFKGMLRRNLCHFFSFDVFLLLFLFFFAAENAWFWQFLGANGGRVHRQRRWHAKSAGKGGVENNCLNGLLFACLNGL